MRINVSDAVVKTAAVDIKALSISGKQVTLAVFRQLIEEPVLAYDNDDQATAKGPLWGTVNYHPDRSCKGSEHEHIHVVWQRGDELRRDTLDLERLRYRPGLWQRAEATGEPGEAWLRAAWVRGWRPSGDYDRHSLPRRLLVRFDAADGAVGVPPDVREAWVAELTAVDRRCWTGRRHYDYEAREEIPCDCGPQPKVEDPPESHDEALAKVDALIVRRQAARKANGELADALGALPQLFIAV